MPALSVPVRAPADLGCHRRGRLPAVPAGPDRLRGRLCRAQGAGRKRLHRRRL